MKRLLLRAVRVLGGRTIVKWVNQYLRKLVKFTHLVQFMIEWGGNPTANWFDHNVDLYYSWHETRNPQGWERGIFSLLAIKQGASVLDICCGDGFYTNYFYSIRAGSVVALDIDPDAIRSANRNSLLSNVKFVVADILTQLPDSKFNNIIWDSGLEYFSEFEIHQVMQDIKFRLHEGGILSGHAILEQQCNSGQKYAFKDKADFLRFVQPYFSNVRVFETIYPARHNMYFFAGEGALPFDEEWDFQAIRNQAK
jgi:ubiquinone/menaquinone biosynthesis C-methylase UbiE